MVGESIEFERYFGLHIIEGSKMYFKYECTVVFRIICRLYFVSIKREGCFYVKTLPFQLRTFGFEVIGILVA